MSEKTERYQTFTDFFPFYLRQHGRPLTRAFHYVGTVLATTALVYGLTVGPAWIMAFAPVFGYGPAWISHALVERNKPATFTYPLWSLIGDYYMFKLFVTGQLPEHLARAGVAPNGATIAAE